MVAGRDRAGLRLQWKEQERTLFSHHGGNEGNAGWGGDWVTQRARAKEASGWEGHFTCSVQEDAVKLCANVVSGQA